MEQLGLLFFRVIDLSALVAAVYSENKIASHNHPPTHMGITYSCKNRQQSHIGSSSKPVTKVITIVYSVPLSAVFGIHVSVSNASWFDTSQRLTEQLLRRQRRHIVLCKVLDSPSSKKKAAGLAFLDDPVAVFLPVLVLK